MPYSKLFIAFLLSTVIGAAQAADATPDNAPAKIGDYQPVGFLSSYAGLKPDPNNDHAFIKRAPAAVAKKYNKVMVDRIKVFFEDDAAYKGIDPTDLKALTDTSTTPSSRPSAMPTRWSTSPAPMSCACASRSPM